MRITFFYLVFALLIFSCNNYMEKVSEVEDYIPSNATAVLKINNLTKFNNSIINNEFLGSVAKSNNEISNAVSFLKKNEFNDSITICFYYTDKLMFNIIGNPKNADSFPQLFQKKEKMFRVLSNNPFLKRNIGKESSFIKNFKKMDQTNSNFSIALNKQNSKNLLGLFFNKSKEKEEGHLYINIDATNNTVLFNGVVDKNYSFTNSNNKINLDEIKNSDINFSFDPGQNLTDDYDLMNTNIDEPIDLLGFLGSKEKVKNFKIFQLKNSNGIANLNGIISDINNNDEKSASGLLFELKLDQNITKGPFVVKNHINKKTELIVQDENNALHLINNLGQIEWSKKIDGQITAKIDQIDSYKNGKLQYVFSTKNKLYLIDRKGRDVGKFPLKFNDEITQPISIFDYDKNKNYRILITQKNELFMFDSKGNRVKGFDYNKNEEIINSPKHFRISNKDLIIFKTTKDLVILNRRGRVRIETKVKLDYSSSDIFRFNNKLITKTNNNKVIEINLNGDTKVLDEYTSELKLSSIEDYLVIQNQNKISINKNMSNIKFGNYTDLRIYNSKNKILVSIFDSQNKENYLFNEKLELIEGFPVKSESAITYLINENKLEFGVKSGDKSIIFFKKTI